MRYDFDTIIDRRGTHSEKWDELTERYGVSPEDGIALWVADMEFLPPPEVNQALARAVEHGIHGYYGDPGDYYAAVTCWMERRHNWRVDPDWIVPTNGIVNAVNILVQSLCAPSDRVILQTPVYYPFFSAVTANGREIAANPLVLDHGKYRMDFDHLERLVDQGARMLILCSPHNPGGRVWTRAELTRLGEICLSRDVLIVSDEIHHDLVYPGAVHTVLASMSPELGNRVVTCTSASKTFNLAGTMTGNVIIGNPEIRRKFVEGMGRCGLYGPNVFGPLAAVAAYEHGEPWLEALLDYLAENRDMVADAAGRMPGVANMPLEGTYLAWLDFSGTGLPMGEVVRRIQEEARLVLNHGHTFGQGGENSMRLNFACARPQLAEALERLTRVFPENR